MINFAPELGAEDDARIRVTVFREFPAALDALARRSCHERGFLRAAWYEAAASGDPLTVLATGKDGSPVAAIPTTAGGFPPIGPRSVPGSYWPFRSILIARDATPGQLQSLLSSPRAVRALGPVWRVGPVLRDDATTAMLEQAAAEAGWTVLVRTLGQNYLLKLAELVASGTWPRKSTLRRIANYERQLARTGTVDFRFVRGGDWNEAAFAALARIEANSWVGRKTDGSGAKFLGDARQALWRRATRDPHIADALSATIMTVDGEPAAFSFDLRAGPRQYSIASSYDERFVAARPGKIVTYRQLQWAASEGVALVDLGAGDSGYKREMGATPGSDIVDLLIVRSRSVGQLLSLKWGAESERGRQLFRASDYARTRRQRFVRQLAAAGALAGTALALAE